MTNVVVRWGSAWTLNGCGRVLPEAPTWFDDYTYGGVPAYWLIIDDWLVFPLVPSTRPCPDMYIAVTCLIATCRTASSTYPTYRPGYTESQ